MLHLGVKHFLQAYSINGPDIEDSFYNNTSPILSECSDKTSFNTGDLLGKVTAFINQVRLYIYIINIVS